MREGSKTFYARELRHADTVEETRLWQQLRNRQVENRKFVRQFPVGPFIVDFACREKKIVIEIDGATHSTDAEIARDKIRTAYLQEHGYNVLRFQNVEVLDGMDQVLAFVAEALKA
jgi:very-short-patch-repair endonuclease